MAWKKIKRCSSRKTRIASSSTSEAIARDESKRGPKQVVQKHQNNESSSYPWSTGYAQRPKTSAILKLR